jgi:hypothetical protein
MSLNVRPSGDPRDQTAAHAPSIGRLLRFFRHRSTSDDDLNAIRDSRFWNQFMNLTSLKTLLLTRGVHIREEDVPLLSFGMLNDLRYNEKGRLPTVEEWEQLDKRSQKLFSYLDDELRKHFELSQTANLIAQLPLLFIFVALLIVALLSLITVIFAVDRLLLLGCYFLWTALLGASVLRILVLLSAAARNRRPCSSRIRLVLFGDAVDDLRPLAGPAASAPFLELGPVAIAVPRPCCLSNAIGLATPAFAAKHRSPRRACGGRGVGWLGCAYSRESGEMPAVPLQSIDRRRLAPIQ